ncbi:DNA methyltransferase [Lamprobacter modestohalophilus]|uniref:DNA methyltransferase n=1 Tax=Lamprobacter modestohalophilus TaxID=1064514 RepID=UPI002ADEED23|nr:DNA methyltransferase [Lamprobacter modestohalophilus]MEA1053312.1 DNA methyltransferase [Lamprobacter modestohalophilus]
MTTNLAQDPQAKLALNDATRTESGPVECLGMTFENEAARRAYFLERLREKLQDPEFRQTPGFPKGDDEAILRMSDPPYYTACPNPFLADFARLHGKPYDQNAHYEREPFAVDVSVGKTDQLYKAHGYHTKVPHLAIVPSILHYTRPGDLVLDGFCGSGMTGLAAQWCGTAPAAYRQKLEAEWKKTGHAAPEWGARRVILNDLGPAASFIAAGYNLPFDVKRFEQEAKRILDEVEAELGWMYEVLHTDGKTKGRINYTVWSEVFSCPECAGEVNFLEEALDKESSKTRSEFPCPHCGVELNKDRLERTFETRIDPITGETWKRIVLRPVFVNYNLGSATHSRPISEADLDVLDRLEQPNYPQEIPSTPFPIDDMYHGSRLEPKGFSRAHHLFLPRAAHALAALWRKANAISDESTRRMILWFVEQAIWGMSVLARYAPTHYSQVNQYLNGVYYVGSQIVDVSPWYILYDQGKRTSKLPRLLKSFTPMPSSAGSAMLQAGDCSSVPIHDHSIDYIFTDPPFGENIYYADLNFLVESWHGVLTNPTDEAIVDQAKKKGILDYQELMCRCFAEYHRVLKPGRWMTVVFSNSSNAIWRAIQEAMGVAGFVVADVRTLDKQQGSYRQVTSSAVKQDLVISAYKPTEALAQRFELGQATPEAAWAFVKEHLGNVSIDVVVERTAQRLLDRMTAFHVQRGLSVPVSGPDFIRGLAQRFPERDGLYFLSEQVVEYDRKRTTASELRQLSLFVSDEASAIQWVRQQLQDKPQSFQDLQPQFMRELQAWAKHEETVELKIILDQNFLHYDGRGPVPSQIHSYLSSNFKDLRNLDKEDAQLIAKARDRWYVPDPNKQADLAQLRERALLKEFEEYKAGTQRKLTLFRTEAVRAGFKACWQERDYATIVRIGDKLSGTIVLEDEQLPFYYDNARTRIGSDG